MVLVIMPGPARVAGAVGQSSGRSVPRYPLSSQGRADLVDSSVGLARIHNSAFRKAAAVLEEVNAALIVQGAMAVAAVKNIFLYFFRDPRSRKWLI